MVEDDKQLPQGERTQFLEDQKEKQAQRQHSQYKYKQEKKKGTQASGVVIAQKKKKNSRKKPVRSGPVEITSCHGVFYFIFGPPTVTLSLEHAHGTTSNSKKQETRRNN